MSIFHKKNTIEIDYEKLANAIVKVQDKAYKETIKNAIVEAKTEIEKNKPNHKYSKELLKLVIEPTLWIITVFSGLFSIGSVIYAVKYWNGFDFGSIKGWIDLSTLFGIFAMSLLMATFCILTLKEIEKEEDVNFLSSIFSNLVSFIALIIAIITFLLNR